MFLHIFFSIFVVLYFNFPAISGNLFPENAPIQFSKLKDEISKENLRVTAGSCPLITFTSPNLEGESARVEYSFLGAMNAVSNTASKCQVKVYITSSFRKSGQTPAGAIVPPATHSNHYVGHAIDFNLVTPVGFCNSVCLGEHDNSYAKCFVDGVRANGLRWGGDFSVPDPVHIDDNLYLTDPSRWTQLFNELQKVC